MMNNSEKFGQAIIILKPTPRVEYTYSGDINSEEDFNKVRWITGEDESGTAIETLTNPHAELSWSAVNTKMDEIQAEYDAKDYARKRKAEYPKIEELVVALYDSEDKVAVDEKRAAVKLKYPKP